MTDPQQAIEMLASFASVGVTAFDVTLTNLAGEKTGFQPGRAYAELRQTVTKRLQITAGLQQNFIIRPRKPDRAELVQLDDLNTEAAAQITPHALMVLCTSPGNFQAWVAVRDAPPDFARRLRKGAGADPSASGATRISGSLNYKSKYAPAFPLVTIIQKNAGNIVSAIELEQAGFVAPREEPRPPRPAKGLRDATPTQASRPMTASGRPSRKKWPSYQFCIQHAPMTHGEDRPDVSRADFTWCRTAIEWGWSREDTARRLMELSTKAKENGERYAVLTAANAAESVERQPYRAKSTPQPRQ